MKGRFAQKIVVVSLAWAVSFAVIVVGAPQESKTPSAAVPTLSEKSKSDLTLSITRLENDELKRQLLVRDMARHKEEFDALVTSLKKEGYLLDIQNMAYVPAPK